MFEHIWKRGREVVEQALTAEQVANVASELNVLKRSREEIRAFQDAGHGVGKDDEMRLAAIEKRIAELETLLKQNT